MNDKIVIPTTMEEDGDHISSLLLTALHVLNIGNNAPCKNSTINVDVDDNEL